jgi:hypothetical protein
LIAAQRAAGDASFTTLKEQLKPSALRAALPAAKAALVALMQNIRRAAAAISIINLMAPSLQLFLDAFFMRTGIRFARKRFDLA